MATSSGQINTKTSAIGSQSLTTINPPLLKNKVNIYLLFSMYFTYFFSLLNMYVKSSLFDIQENVMNETVCSENAEKSDLKLVVEAKVSQHLEFVLAEEVQIKNHI